VTEGETKPDEKEDEVEGESKEAPAEPKDEL